MSAPRKISAAQAEALGQGRDIARANQRRRVAYRQAAEKAAAERAKAEASHNHRWHWGNWEYVLHWTHEVRECRGCGFAEIRKVRL